MVVELLVVVGLQVERLQLEGCKMLRIEHYSAEGFVVFG